MKTNIFKHIEILIERYPELKTVENAIAEAYCVLEKSFKMVENY